MTNTTLESTVHLTPAERYFRGEITLDQATSAEIKKMREERRETRSDAANMMIRVLTLVVAIPLLLVTLFNPRRWC